MSFAHKILKILRKKLQVIFIVFIFAYVVLLQLPKTEESNNKLINYRQHAIFEAKYLPIVEFSDNNLVNNDRIHSYSKSIRYLQGPKYAESIIYSRNGDHINEVQIPQANLTIEDFFHVLRTPQCECSKLIRFGGGVACYNGDISSLDGFKYVCLDEQMEIKSSRNSNSCLALSFGTSPEVSFDDALDVFSCEVHMFDIFDYSESVRGMKNGHFHHIGLDAKHQVIVDVTSNTTFRVDNIDGHLRRLNLRGRAIHILKIDIEEKEWPILAAFKNLKILDFVGQIAIELHIASLVELPKSLWSSRLQNYLYSLKSLEDQGFKRVLYWDTLNEARSFHSGGRRYEIGFEVLLVNSNWFNETFRQELKNIGLQFS